MLSSQAPGTGNMSMWLGLSQVVSPSWDFKSGADDPKKQGQGRMGLGSGTCKFQSSEATARQNELGSAVHGQQKPHVLLFGMTLALHPF